MELKLYILLLDKIATRSPNFYLTSKLIDVVYLPCRSISFKMRSEKNHKETVSLLLKHGADPALKDRESGTLILHTVNRGAEISLIKMMKYLINIECVDDKGRVSFIAL